MIGPDCKVCLGIGWVCEKQVARAWLSVRRTSLSSS